jgi:hypothetical protein
MYRKFNAALFFALILVLLTSCRKDKSPNWDVDLFTPLIKTSLTIDDLIPDSLLQVNPDHTVTLVYKNPIYNFDLDSIVNVPDTISSTYYPAFPGIVINPGQTIFNQTKQETFDFNGAEVTRLDLHSGFITVDFVNTVHEKVIISYKILSATKNGQCFEINETIPAATTQPYHYLKSFDVSGYSMDMTGQSHLASNHLVTASSATLSPEANAVTLTSQDVFNMYVMFQGVSLDYARGYFASQNFEFGPESTAIKLFSNIQSGTIDFESIKMFLYIKNGFGVDARVKFKELTAVNTNTGNEVSLNSTIIGQTINIGRAIETWDPASPVIPTQYSFDLGSSNILDLIENLPDQMRYSLEVSTNPMGNVSAGNDFVYRDHYLETYLDMEIPLSFKTNDLCLSDTVDFSLGDPANVNSINGGELVLLADNGFPFDAELVLTALDSLGNVIDIVVDHNHINEALLNTDGFAENPMRSEIHILLSRERIDKLFTASKMLITAHFNTEGTDYIKIYDSYRLDLKLTGKFNYEF